MKTNVSETKRPRITSSILVEGDDNLVAFAQEVESMHGATITMQDHKGRQTPVRINTSTLRHEVYVNGAWKQVGG